MSNSIYVKRCDLLKVCMCKKAAEMLLSSLCQSQQGISQLLAADMPGKFAHVRNEGAEDFLLAFEVHVESPQGNAGPLRDAGDRRLRETALSELRFRSMQQLLAGLAAPLGLGNLVRS